MRIVHWQDLGSIVVGLWVCVSAFVLGLGGSGAWVTLILGLFVVLFAVEGLVMPSYLEELSEAMIGIALIVAPWSVGYDSPIAMINSVAAGALVVAFAISEVFTDEELLTRWREGRSHPVA